MTWRLRSSTLSVSYKTLKDAVEATATLVDRRSRFIAQIKAVSSEHEAKLFVQEVSSRYPDARHNVFAWVLADGRERCSDDGEPQKTAGMPTLEELRAAGLANICCVVTRYFGGTLLGPGGLVRAYSSSTRQAIIAAKEAGNIVTMRLVRPVSCVVPYALYGRVLRLVAECSGKVLDTVFSDDVQMNCIFLVGQESRFSKAVGELAAGEDLCTIAEPRFGEL